MSEFFRIFLLITFVPVALFKFWRFFRRFGILMFQQTTTEKARKSLERLWIKSSAIKNSKYGFLLFILVMSIYIKPIQALVSNHDNQAALALEKRIAKNFSKKFCNSIAFGISKESSMNFSKGEIQKEQSKNPLLIEINQDSLSYRIADEILYNCGIAIGLKGQKGLQQLNMDLYQMNLLNKVISDNSKN